MNNKFDEFAKAMSQSGTRRAALKKFGVGLVGAALTALGPRSAAAAPRLTPGYVCCRYIAGNGGNVMARTALCVGAGQACPGSLLGPGGHTYSLLSQTAVKNCGGCK